jgi:membrane-associated phospholipid phosphatase
LNQFFHAAALALLIPLQLAVSQLEQPTSKTFFTRRDAAVAGVFLAATVGLSAFDPKIGRFFEDTSLNHVRLGQRLDDIFTHVNETTLTVGGLVVYGAARLTKSNTIADIAFHATESVVVASLASQLIRGPLGRSRPRETNFEDQYDFHPFQGFGNFKYRAFPSIHSSSGFAAASAIVAETKRRSPEAVKYVAPIAYAAAVTPGLARMYLGQHWASDIFAGAFMGTFAGWRVVNYSHTHPRTKTDRIFLNADPAGVVLSWRF